MKSVVVKPVDFNRVWTEQSLSVGDFKYIFLAEGDSWMERSSFIQGSLPDFFAQLMDERGETVLIVNLALFGDELRQIGTVQRNDFKYWLKQFKYDALLFSAGGNDYIDAAKKPPAGEGVLKSYVGGGAPASGKDAVNWDAVDRLRSEYLTPCFKAIYDLVQGSVDNKDMPILVNSYDVPVARDAPAVKEAWLYEAYAKNKIPEKFWPDVTSEIFEALGEDLTSWAADRDSVSLVPTRGTLDPADPKSHGESGDWINEIHPNRRGWEKLAPIWLKAFDEARTKQAPT